MIKKLNWRALSMKDRNTVVESIKTAILTHDGSILHFTMFSDLALSLTIEIEERHISALYHELCRLVHLSEPEPEDFRSGSDTEWFILLHISFGQGKGDLEVEVPMVPG